MRWYGVACAKVVGDTKKEGVNGEKLEKMWFWIEQYSAFPSFGQSIL